MLYHDTLYGTEEITEPILLALLEAPAVQRLRGILQHGISGLIGVTAPITRFDHSVGAMILVRRWGASEAEQIAALLHDVSHTAFSHVLDHVFDSAVTQSYHEQVKESYLAGTELPQLLAQFGYNWQDFLHEEAYPLLEQPAPRLCADRVDYFMRDAIPLGVCTLAEVQNLLPHLVVHHGRVVVNDLPAGRWLGERFMQADQASWANFWEVGLYEVTARAIQRGFAAGVLSPADVWLEDVPFWEKLHQSRDPELNYWLSLVRQDVDFVWDEVAPDFVVSTKIRTIDPEVLVKGEARPLSELDPPFAQLRSSYLQEKQRPWPMKIISGEKGGIKNEA